jgi:formate hydrogenlyase transcriptional activator
MEALLRYQWPGNIRELQNFIERSVLLTSGSILHPPLAGLKFAAEPESPAAITLKEAERRHIRRALEEVRGVVGGPNGAAARLGVKRSTLYSRMRKLGISRRHVMGPQQEVGYETAEFHVAAF